MNNIDEMKIIESLNELNADYDSVEEALFSIENEVKILVQWQEMTLSSKTNDKIKNIKGYIECIMREKKINWIDIYQLNQNMELQNLYDSLESVWIEKFTDWLWYNMWKTYINKWNINMVIMDQDTTEWLNYESFWNLTFDELVDLEDLILQANNASIKIQIWPEIDQILTH